MSNLAPGRSHKHKHITFCQWEKRVKCELTFSATIKIKYALEKTEESKQSEQSPCQGMWKCVSGLARLMVVLSGIFPTTRTCTHSVTSSPSPMTSGHIIPTFSCFHLNEERTKKEPRGQFLRGRVRCLRACGFFHFVVAERTRAMPTDLLLSFFGTRLLIINTKLPAKCKSVSAPCILSGVAKRTFVVFGLFRCTRLPATVSPQCDYFYNSYPSEIRAPYRLVTLVALWHRLRWRHIRDTFPQHTREICCNGFCVAVPFSS